MRINNQNLLRLIFFFLTFILNFNQKGFSHVGHYDYLNKLEMEVLRNNEVIGYNFIFLREMAKKQLLQIRYNLK